MQHTSMFLYAYANLLQFNIGIMHCAFLVVAVAVSLDATWLLSPPPVGIWLFVLSFQDTRHWPAAWRKLASKHYKNTFRSLWVMLGPKRAAISFNACATAKNLCACIRFFSSSSPWSILTNKPESTRICFAIPAHVCGLSLFVLVLFLARCSCASVLLLLVVEVRAWAMAALSPASRGDAISESSTECAITDAFWIFRWEVWPVLASWDSESSSCCLS